MQHFVLDQFDEFARKKNLTDEQKKAVKPELDRVVQSVHHLSQPHWLEDRLKELDQKLIEMGVKAPGDAPAVTATTQQSHLVNRLEMSLGPLSMNLSTQQLAEVRPQLQSLITAFGNDRKPGELLSREQIEASAALDRKLVQMGHRPLQAVSPMQIDFNERFAKFVKDNKLTDEQIKKLQPDAQWAIKELDVKYDGSTTIYHSAYNRLDELGREMEKMGFDRKALLTQQELDGIKRTLEYQADPDGLKVIMQRMEEIHKKRQSGESSAEEEEEFRLWEDHLLRMLKLKTRVAV